ncbi:peptidoglycan-binding protein [Candidatus Omnitrophota bacterium]
MKREFFILLTIFFVICMAGCGRQGAESERLEEPVSMEELSRIDQIGEATPEVQEEALPAAVTEDLGVLPPAPPYKPTVRKIQMALKSAGLYEGKIDGKRGPKTEKAIRDFQESLGLKVDGVVGLKTWEKLSGYLREGEASE